MESYLKHILPIGVFTALYLVLGCIYFVGRGNLEFVIYVVLIIVVFIGVLLTLQNTRFSPWMLWLLSIWGFMHILGGAVKIGDHVLFAQRIYPFLDRGGDFYILKYDQIVHAYLYGLVASMAHHILRHVFGVVGYLKTVWLLAVMISMGISAMNEIMEFIISLNMPNGVGGYENTLLDLCSNFVGAAIAATLSSYSYIQVSLPKTKAL